MQSVVWLGANTLTYPEGGGHLWAYLNWALGLRQAGCEVVWLEHVDQSMAEEELNRLLTLLREKLARYGLGDAIALCTRGLEEMRCDFSGDLVPLAAVEGADLFLNMGYAAGDLMVKRFRRSALLDIDPGLLQAWMSEGLVRVPRHDCYFTIGEGTAQSPYNGEQWNHTPPCVALDYWPVLPACADAPFTTVTHWSAAEWFSSKGEVFPNDKRAGFLPYLDLPQRTSLPLELALCFGADDQLRPLTREAEEYRGLKAKGWRVTHSHAVSKTPWDYQRYIQQSLGEFSCAKPAFVRLQTGWISDRTICYLASGRPAIVQHTGPSRFLPQAEGLFRFRTPEEAAEALETVSAKYEWHSHQARRLAEEHFAADKVVPRLLDRALSRRRSRYFPASQPEPAVRLTEKVLC